MPSIFNSAVMGGGLKAIVKPTSLRITAAGDQRVTASGDTRVTIG